MQRRISNREACRDEWLAMMRSAERAPWHNSGMAAGSTQGLHADTGADHCGVSDRTGGAGAAASITIICCLVPRECQSIQLQLHGNRYTGDSSVTMCCPAGSFTHMAEEAQQLLGRLHPANYGAFASIIVAAMLRAAAVGEAFLDDSLSSLAQRDPSRFQQLNERLTVGHCDCLPVPFLCMHPCRCRPCS